jgi:glycosyltransferase involved in cell wall biosynthesis
MLKAFPNAPLYTSLFHPDATFPEFRRADVRTLSLDRVHAFREHHRLALPLLARVFEHLCIDADILICSSSGWAHGARTKGRKLVYCHAPARWLYQGDRYIGKGHLITKAVLRTLAPTLREWDRRAAHSAHRYLTQCQSGRDRIRSLYGIEAEILPAPYRLGPTHPRAAVGGIEPGFFLCVARLLPYKNVDVAIAAIRSLPKERLVIAGDGPEAAKLRRSPPANAQLLGAVTDDELAWLYANCQAVIACAYEDYGLTVLEAAAFGKPAVALRFGGFLDTVREDETGVFFETPVPAELRAALLRMKGQSFERAAILRHARRYSEEAFIRRLREIVVNEERIDRPA